MSALSRKIILSTMAPKPDMEVPPIFSILNCFLPIFNTNSFLNSLKYNIPVLRALLLAQPYQIVHMQQLGQLLMPPVIGIDSDFIQEGIVQVWILKINEIKCSLFCWQGEHSGIKYTHVHWKLLINLTRLRMDNMETRSQFNIYEFLDRNGDPVEFVCDGHIDSTVFREKCFHDYYVEPMVVQHQWRKSRKFVIPKEGRKRGKSYTKLISCTSGESGATPVTVGLIKSMENQSVLQLSF